MKGETGHPPPSPPPPSSLVPFSPAAPSPRIMYLDPLFSPREEERQRVSSLLLPLLLLLLSEFWSLRSLGRFCRARAKHVFCQFLLFPV